MRSIYFSGLINTKVQPCKAAVTTHYRFSHLALGIPVSSIWLALPDDPTTPPQDLHISWLWWSEVFTKELNRVILYFSFFIILLHRLANVYLYQLFNVFIHVNVLFVSAFQCSNCLVNVCICISLAFSLKHF